MRFALFTGAVAASLHGRGIKNPEAAGPGEPSELLTLDFGWDGVPFVELPASDAVTTGLDFGWGGVPFVGN